MCLKSLGIKKRSYMKILKPFLFFNILRIVQNINKFDLILNMH